MKILLGFILTWTALAAPPTPLATIHPDFFKPGQVWHWKYYQDGVLYSTEKYTVLEARPDRVLIQMSTRLAGQRDFIIHHRQEVNPQRCLLAHKNPAHYRPWSINLYFKNNGRWELVDGLTTTLAFEEKFNCNPHHFQSRYRNTYFKTLTTDLGAQELFQQRKGPRDNSSWYFNHSEYAGLMAFKRMSQPEEKVQYEIRFSISE